VATNGKAKDGYHDTIWLRDVKTGVTVDLLAPTGGSNLAGRRRKRNQDMAAQRLDTFHARLRHRLREPRVN
jgi:hypothetical protein